MGHPHLTEHADAVPVAKVSYSDMQLGEILKLTALDAGNRGLKTFRIQIVGFVEEKHGLSPVFRLLGDDFNFFGNDKTTPTRMRKGSLAGAGAAGTLIPQTVFINMVFWGEINLGRDCSFEYVDGREEFVYAAKISCIERWPRPASWREPKTAVARYVRKVARLCKQLANKEKAHGEKLKKPLIIRTANSVYRLSAAEEEGIRTLTNVGKSIVYDKARLTSAQVGGLLVIDVRADDKWITLKSSVIQSIDLFD
ncbi:MAG: hypothetical protein WC750_05650 [Patescibacteria group bacterium]